MPLNPSMLGGNCPWLSLDASSSAKERIRERGDNELLLLPPPLISRVQVCVDLIERCHTWNYEPEP